MLYRKKPVIIDAFCYAGDFKNSFGEYCIPNWAVKAFENKELFFKGQGELYVKTLEGDMHAAVGDYIIQGVQGEIYPCKPDIFEQTYEPSYEPFCGMQEL